MPLVIYDLRGGHTRTYTHAYFGGMKVISGNQACTWFKKMKSLFGITFGKHYRTLYTFLLPDYNKQAALFK